MPNGNYVGGTGGFGNTGEAGTGGGAGFGGGLFVRAGILTLQRVAFHNNNANHGVSENNGQGKGGGLFVLHITANPNGNDQGMPATLPSISAASCEVTFSGNAAQDDAGSPTDNDNVFGNLGDATGPCSPNLTLDKTVQPAEVLADHRLVTYTIALANVGFANDTNVTLTDTLPTEVAFGQWVEQPSGVVRNGNAITWTGGLAAGENITFTFTATHTSGIGDIANTAHVSSTVQQLTDAATFTACLNDLTVQNANDSGPGSLRQAIADVCRGGTIYFADDTSITLNSPLLLDKDLSLDGSDHSIIISGDYLYRVFTVSHNAHVTLAHLIIILGRDLSSECYGYSCGGGLKVEAGSTVTLTHSTVANSRAYYGGGIFNYGALRILHSTINNNIADSWDGGIYSHGSLVVENSTISDNTAAAGNVGGLASAGSLTVTHSTIAGNRSPDIGGLFHQGTSPAYLYNNIIANSTGADCALATGVTPAANVHNLVEDGTCSTGGVGFMTGDPLLGPLTDNGGDTWTHALQHNSPAIDVANPTYCLATDQRGLSRNDLQCDAGAYELRYADSPTVIRSASSTTTTTFGPTLMGLQRDAGYTDPGVITVTKAAWSYQGPESIGAVWTISPTVTSGFSLTLRLCVTPAEMNGLSEGSLFFYRSNGLTYTKLITIPTWSTVNTYRCAALSGITQLSRWTLATDTPTAVRVDHVMASSNPINWNGPIGLGVLLAAVLVISQRVRRKRL